jgi:hypothetical protein
MSGRVMYVRYAVRHADQTERDDFAQNTDDSVYSENDVTTFPIVRSGFCQFVEYININKLMN